jgi:hypothetical protein
MVKLFAPIARTMPELAVLKVPTLIAESTVSVPDPEPESMKMLEATPGRQLQVGPPLALDQCAVLDQTPEPPNQKQLLPPPLQVADAFVVKSPKNQDAACRTPSRTAPLTASNTPAEETPSPLMSLWSVATQSIPAPGEPLASGEPSLNT